MSHLSQNQSEGTTFFGSDERMRVLCDLRSLMFLVVGCYLGRVHVRDTAVSGARLEEPLGVIQQNVPHQLHRSTCYECISTAA